MKGKMNNSSEKLPIIGMIISRERHTTRINQQKKKDKIMVIKITREEVVKAVEVTSLGEIIKEAVEKEITIADKEETNIKEVELVVIKIKAMKKAREIIRKVITMTNVLRLLKYKSTIKKRRLILTMTKKVRLVVKSTIKSLLFMKKRELLVLVIVIIMVERVEISKSTETKTKILKGVRRVMKENLMYILNTLITEAIILTTMKVVEEEAEVEAEEKVPEVEEEALTEEEAMGILALTKVAMGKITITVTISKNTIRREATEAVVIEVKIEDNSQKNITKTIHPKHQEVKGLAKISSRSLIKGKLLSKINSKMMTLNKYNHHKQQMKREEVTTTIKETLKTNRKILNLRRRVAIYLMDLINYDCEEKLSNKNQDRLTLFCLI
jgi:hypothetical protein